MTKVIVKKSEDIPSVSDVPRGTFFLGRWNDTSKTELFLRYYSGVVSMNDPTADWENNIDDALTVIRLLPEVTISY